MCYMRQENKSFVRQHGADSHQQQAIDYNGSSQEVLSIQSDYQAMVRLSSLSGLPSEAHLESPQFEVTWEAATDGITLLIARGSKEVDCFD